MTAAPDPDPLEPVAPPVKAEPPLGAWERIKDHKVLQWLVAYLGAALALAQTQDLLATAFEWPSIVGRTLMITLIVGLPITATVAWYHGHRALRQVGVGELSILSSLILIGALFFAVALRRDNGAPAPALATLSTAAAVPTGVTRAPASGTTDALPNKVAVLPCENHSPDPSDAYFASGLHQDIIWQLDKLRNLNTIPRLTVLRYADTDLTIAEIAAELRVRALLDCTIRYADNRVRITAELIDATGLQTLWQGDYEPSLVPIQDVFAVQADIAMNIANALAIVFNPGERELLAKPPTVSSEAYVLFLKGYEEPDYDATIELFEQAAAADAEFAAPQAALAFLWASELINTNYTAAVAPGARADHESKVREYAERALALDATVPFARSALGITAMLKWHWSEAYERLVRARELTPNDVTQYDIFLLSYLGRYEEAMDIVERASELYAGDPTNFAWRGWALGLQGRYDEAATAFATAVTAAPGPQGLLERDWLTRMEIARGNDAAALEHLRLAETITGTDRQPVFLPMWAYCYGRLGLADDARRIVAEMQEKEAAGTRFGAGGWAMAQLAIGEQQRALEWLAMAAEKAAAHELDEGFFNLMALRANVTNDDRLRQQDFVAVIERIEGD